jgi:Resolvase, N terminal domain
MPPPKPGWFNVDHGLTGTNRDRPGLRLALAACRAGDTLVVTKLDRTIARSSSSAAMIASAVASCKHLALGHAPKPPLDDHGMEPLCELELDHRNDRQLVLADLVLRPWRREAEGLSTTISSSRGMPVLLLSSWKVVPLSPANRSNAGTSR